MVLAVDLSVMDREVKTSQCPFWLDHLTLVEGIFNPYKGTAFGRLKEILCSRIAATIYDF